MPLVQGVKDRQKRFGPGKVNPYLTINPYINQLGWGTFLQGDDSCAGTGWMYPAMKVEGLACQVLGKVFGEDDEIKVQLLFPTFESLRQIVDPQDFLQWVYFMSEIERKIIESTIPLAQQAIPRALGRRGIVVVDPQRIVPTRFSRVKDYMDKFGQRGYKEYVNREKPIREVYPSEGISNEEGKFIELDIEFRF